MDFFDFFQLLNKALLKSKEEQLWQQWLVDYARMDKKSFLSFEEYKDKAFKPSIKNKKIDKEEALGIAEKIKKLDQERR